jgi:hypothetical protein
MDWVKYLRNELPADKMEQMENLLCQSEEQRAELHGLQLLLKDEGLTPQSDLAAIAAALEQLEQQNWQFLWEAFDNVQAAQELLDEINQFLTEPLGSDPSVELPLDIVHHEQLTPQGYTADTRRLETLVFDLAKFMHQEIQQVKAEFLTEFQRLRTHTEKKASAAKVRKVISNPLSPRKSRLSRARATISASQNHAARQISLFPNLPLGPNAASPPQHKR